MLLPGTFAKLEPPEECTFLDGEKLLQNTAAAAQMQVLIATVQYRSNQNSLMLLLSTSAKWELPEDGSFFDVERRCYLQPSIMPSFCDLLIMHDGNQMLTLLHSRQQSVSAFLSFGAAPCCHDQL